MRLSANVEGLAGSETLRISALAADALQTCLPFAFGYGDLRTLASPTWMLLSLDLARVCRPRRYD